MTSEPRARFAQDGPVGTVTIDNPPLNVLGQEMIADLQAAFSQAEAADGLRALMLRGEGNVFSAGADVTQFAVMSIAQVRPLVGSFIDLGHRIGRCRSRLLRRCTGCAWPAALSSRCSAI